MSSRMIVVRGLGTDLAFALGAGGLAYATTTDQSTTHSTTSQSTSVGAAGGSTVPARLPVRPGQDRQPSGSTAAATTATTEQVEGVVYLSSTVASGTSAGTGMILSSDGTILTNYHVVEGATTIEAQDATTGEEYDATIVGYDAQNDVAVLRLRDASGLDTVTIDTAPTGAGDDLAVGDAITGVGDAGGDKGTASAAVGTVTALGQSISVGSDSGQAAEQLTDMIEVAADIQAGDSGGPLYDAEGEVVGIDTAASTGSSDVTGWAIPIDRALSVVDQVESGTSSGTVVVGSPGFLGVSLGSGAQGQTLQVPGPGQQTTTAPATVSGVVDGSAAAGAGIAAGSTITAFDGQTIDSADALAAAVAEHAAGDQVQVSWSDASGQAHTATVSLGSAA